MLSGVTSDVPLVVAVDGPAGAGKSTVSRRLADALGLPYVNTGFMYRAVAARALDGAVPVDDGTGLARLAAAIRFELAGRPGTLVIDGAEPGERLTASDVEAIVSAVSRHPGVRATLRSEQRRLGGAGAVMEGRDIGTVVFPDAAVKIFLFADPGVRTTRRRRERRAEGHDAAVHVSARDALDARTTPLEPAADAVVIDTTDLSVGEVVARALDAVGRLYGDRAGVSDRRDRNSP